MDNTQTVIEFTDTSHRHPDVKGDGRILGFADAGGLVTLSDVAIPTVAYNQYKDLLIASAKGSK